MARVLVEFTLVLAMPFIAVVLFPALRKFSETLAVAHVGFRFLEAVVYIAVQANLLGKRAVHDLQDQILTSDLFTRPTVWHAWPWA